VSSQLHRRVEHPHGTYHRYKLRRDPCRCQACREAAIRFRREQRDGSKRYVCPGCGFRSLEQHGHTTCVKSEKT
jgi:hypothetical protein